MPDYKPRIKPLPIRAARAEAAMRVNKGDWIGVTSDGAILCYTHEQFTQLYTVQEEAKPLRVKKEKVQLTPKKRRGGQKGQPKGYIVDKTTGVSVGRVSFTYLLMLHEYGKPVRIKTLVNGDRESYDEVLTKRVSTAFGGLMRKDLVHREIDAEGASMFSVTDKGRAFIRAIQQQRSA